MSIRPRVLCTSLNIRAVLHGTYSHDAQDPVKMLMFLDNVHDTVALGTKGERADTLDMLNVMRLNTALGSLPRDMFEQVMAGEC